VETAEKYKEQFIQEAREFREKLQQMLENWQDFILNPQGIEELFRTVHSLKSGASFLQYNLLESMAHGLEEHLTKGTTDLETMKPNVQQLVDLLYQHDWKGEEDKSIGEDSIEEPPHIQRQLSNIEMKLLKEARQRGEQLYRLDCLIDRDEPMKKARAFLILNNLELKANVIRTVPKMDDKDGAFNPFVVYLTTQASPQDIEHWISVDRVERIQMKQILMDDIQGISLGAESLFTEILEPPMRSLQLQRHELEELGTLWEELINAIQGIKLEAKKGRRIGKILLEGRRRMAEISQFKPSYLIPELKERILGYAMRQHKPLDLEILGDDLLLPREWKNPIFRIIQQLVRNSISHGLENPAQRQAKGKSPKGNITLEFLELTDKLQLRYSDDGRGVDESQLRRRASDFLTLEKAAEMDLLELLLLKGLSVKGEANLQAGRGMGMDLLAQLIEKELQGNLTLENRPGLGLTFVIDLPKTGKPGYLKFRQNEKNYLISLRYVRATGRIIPSKLWKNRQGELHYKDQGFNALFTMEGKVTNTVTIKKCQYWIRIYHMGKKACLAVEELLSEVQLQEVELAQQPLLGSHFFTLPGGDILVSPNLIE
jgi:two-component system chemotaxis sensor kinase CheA